MVDISKAQDRVDKVRNKECMQLDSYHKFTQDDYEQKKYRQ